MKLTKLAPLAVGLALALAAPAHADPDIDFENELHGYGIYGARDYNAWLGKLVCKRLDKGIDADAAASAHFITTNLAKGATQVQAWQFLGASINNYCPENRHFFDEAAAQQG